MDKNAIKKYAVWARRELIDRVSKRAAMYGITEKDMGDPNADSVNGHLLTAAEKRQRQALIRRIQEKGYQQVMEEVAYTWFNRFAALRFMEVNGYLPTHIRVFTDDEGRFKPQILAEAIHLELDGLNMDRVYQLKDANQEEELFKYLLIVQCNALNSILPGMFQKIEDYTELLLPDYLLREGSVIEQMITLIPEDDWKDQVQIIGWLYQYYNTEPKDKVFADLKKNIKISKQNIPAATQLFTPDWIVHYMVENSLGRLWVEGHPSAREKYLPAHNADGSVRVEEGKWNYYLEEAEQEPEVQAQLAEIRKQYAVLKPEEILAIDPCAGSGHILCVLFDVLVNIYEDYGYTAREAAVSIVQNNLWGLDIDDRAAQLSYFAVMMKARQYDRRFFSKGVQPHVYAIQESNDINREHLNYLGRGLSDIERNNAVNQMNALLDEFIDAKEYGSILQPREYDWALLLRFVEDTTPMQQMTFGEAGLEATQLQLWLMIAQGQALAQKYHAVVTNPPYMGAGGMGVMLINYLQAYYSDVKSDLFSVVIKRIIEMVQINGLFSYIAPQSVLFLSTQVGLRKHILNATVLVNMLDLGVKAFDSGFGTATSVFAKGWPKGTIAACIDLTESDDKKENYLSKKASKFAVSTATFTELPGCIFSYACTSAFARWFLNKKIGDTEVLDCGIKTGGNNIFVRLWYEVPLTKIAFSEASIASMENGTYKWFKYSQGGGYHRWYGQIENVVDFENGAQRIRETISKSTYRLRDKSKYFLEGMVWPMVGTNNFSCRFLPFDVLPDIASNVLYCRQEYQWDLLAYMNSKVFNRFMILVNPTVNYPIDSVASVPGLPPQNDSSSQIKLLSQMNVELCKIDWNSFETSWDFQRHPLVTPAIGQHYLRLSDCWRDWERACEERFAQLKANEEELNRIFIEIYGLQDELTPEVDDKDVTVRKADLGRDIRSLISYAVGCMLGRYSLDKPGLAFAGGNWQEWLSQQDAMTYAPDKDGILPITDDEYFYDDIVTIFVDWVKTVYGTVTLEENLTFIANALGGKGSPREVIREYFLNDFYKDHLKIYQKRPIYWLFDSGKKNGFKALVYMHRWQPDTIARVRTDYVHEMQSRYRTAIADVEQRINGASTSERVKLTKRLTALQAQAEELRKYEEKVHHLADQMIGIDLDDGVKVNYAKFADVLAPIK